MADLLATFTPRVGDAVFLRAGTVHSLSGLVVFEVQENSEVTFRLYDWDRVDHRTGKPRPLQVEQAVRELRRCVTNLGFKGLRVVPWLWDAPPTDRSYYPLYATCVELGVPFFTQVGHTGPLRPSETGRPIPYIDQVALDFPELVIIGGHIGYPWTEEMIAVARNHENVYIDTSAYTAKRYPPELVRYMQTNSGRRKVLFGTNYPMILHSHALEDLDGLGLDEETRELFLGGNAQRLLDVTERAAA